MNIRKYSYEDRDKLIRLWKKVFPNNPPHNEPGKVITEKLAVDDLIFVAENGANIVEACMAGYDGHRGWLYSLAVEEKHQRKGIGRELVQTTISALAKLGCGKVNLQIRAGNKDVAYFYKSLGFRTEDRISMGIHVEKGA